MPAKDLTHNTVKTALRKEGWTITHDPYFTASCAIPSPVTDFHAALGQFMNYRLALQHEEPERTLYLAAPVDTYESFFLLPFGQIAIRHYQLRLMVYSIQREELVTWIK